MSTTRGSARGRRDETEGISDWRPCFAEDGGEPRLNGGQGETTASNTAKVSATVTRLTGEKQALNFAPDKDSLLSREFVPEPHAFEISIVA